MPLSLPARSGGRTRGTWSGVSLIGADGRHTVTVALEEGAATYSLDVRLATPGRPRGTVDLSPDEPRLAAVGSPIRGGSARIVRLLGVNFSPGVRPTVRFGGERALVVAVAPTGIWMDVSPPIRPVGTVCDVLVTNPDGQSVRAPSYFEYVDPPPPALDRFVPAVAAAYVASSLRFTVALREPAPFGGVPIDLVVEGAIGSVPSTVTVSGGESFVRFDLASAPQPAAGRILASYGGRTVAADVSVVAPPEPEPDDPPAPPPPLPDFLDVSGWTISQTSSARTYTIPQGTRLRQGDRVVIGRAAPQASFETYWGVTFGDDVRYLTNDPTNTGASSDDWPSINGDETFTLRDASGALVDGPTVAMQAGGGANYSRTPGTAAGQPDSWTVVTTLAPGAGPTPGSVPTSSDGAKHGLWISEFSDVSSGANRYAYEFVELCFDGHP